MNKNRIIEDYLQGKHPIEQESWELPSAQELERDEALFESLMAQKKAPKRIKLWPLAVAACVAGFVAIFLVPPRKTNVEPEIQPVVAEVVEQPVPKAPNASECSDVPEASDKPEPARSTNSSRTYKARKVSKPIEEPLLAEVETDEDMEDPFLAIAEQMQDIRLRGEQVRHEVAQLIDKQANLQ